MNIRFWGTRGSIAKAGPGTVRYGGNTSCVEVRSSGGTVVVLDCGTGAHGLGHEISESPEPVREGHILVSHTHWDHIQGFPFFTPLNAPRSTWHVYGPGGCGPGLRETLAGQMQYSYFPVDLDELRAHLEYHELGEGTFECGDISVTARYLNHPALTLGYRLEADGAVVVYSTDHEPHCSRLATAQTTEAGYEDESHRRFLAGADLVIHDAQYTAAEYPSKTGWGHSTVEYAVDAAVAADARMLALYHHDPSRDDDAVDGLVELARDRGAASGSDIEIFGAAEGAQLEIGAPDASLPRLRAGSTDSTQSAEEIGAVARAGEGGVLVAVRDEGAAETLRDAVWSDGLALSTARETAQAFDVIRTLCPALVVVEIGDASLDALEICRRVSASRDRDGRDVPVIIVSTVDDPIARSCAIDAGACDWLVAPLTSCGARTRIRAWILRAASRRSSAPRAGEQAVESPLPRNAGDRA